MTNESIMSGQDTTEDQVYELSFIFDNKLTESAASEKLEALKELIASQNGGFISEEVPYKRELAYEMTRVQHNLNVKFEAGYFGWVKFEISPENISQIDKVLKLDEEIVRFMIIKTERGDDVFTKNQNVFKTRRGIFLAETVEKNNENVEVNIDTTSEISLAEIVPEDFSTKENNNKNANGELNGIEEENKKDLVESFEAKKEIKKEILGE